MQPTESGDEGIPNSSTTSLLTLEKTTVHLRRTLATIAVGALGLTAALASPAGAAETTLTVTLTGGSLSISAPASGSASASVAPGSTISVSLADTTVTDNRGSLAGWTVTGSATDLTYNDGAATYTIPKAVLTWVTGSITTSNGSLTNVAAGGGGSMAAAFPVALAAVLSGAGTFAYPATITGVVPVNLKAGAYTGTVTQSVA